MNQYGFDWPRPVFRIEDVSPDIVMREARKIARERLRRGQLIASPDDMRQYLIPLYAELVAEVFGMIWLSNRHRVIAFDHSLFKGTIDGAAVYPREIVRRALQLNAAACVAVHQHPGGDPTPSQADIALTGRLKQTLALIDVRLLDHIVVGADETVSLAERGLL